MSDISFKEIEALGCDDRYEVFLGMVSDERDIWILLNESNEFLKVYSEDNDIEYLPVWPHSDFTESYCKNVNEKLTPKCISVPEFFAKWIPGLEGDGLKVGVFPKAGQDVWIMDPAELKSDLQDEFSNFSM